MRTIIDFWSDTYLKAVSQPGESPLRWREPDPEDESALASAWQRVLVALGLDSLAEMVDPASPELMYLIDARMPPLVSARDWLLFNDATQRYVRNLVLHAESEDIAVTWENHSEFLGGFVYRRAGGPRSIRRDPKYVPKLIDPDDLPRVSRADVILVLNRRQDWVSTFDVLVHELAHVLLGHLGAMRGAREGRLAIKPHRTQSLNAHEVEAYAVGNIVRAALGGSSAVIRKDLVTQVLVAAKAGDLAKVDVLEVFIAAEIICAWCGSPPQRLGVAAGPRKRPPTRPIGWKTKVGND